MNTFPMQVIRVYQGNGYLFLLYLAAVAYLFLKERNRITRILLVYCPVCLLSLFLIPLTSKAYARILDAETYYRLLWLLPQCATIAWAGIRLIRRRLYLSLILSAAIIILAGSYVYQGPYMPKAENPFHLPGEVVRICDAILPENGDMVCAVFPDELIHFVRQYSSRIVMPYGREALVTSWGGDFPFHRLMLEGGMETGELSVTAKGYNCNYIILHEDQEFQEPMENYGYVIYANIDGYNIWKDTTITWPN